MIRTATREDAVAIADLVNAAFQVEAFFKIGDRTSTEEILDLMDSGEFLVLETPALRGCLYLECSGERGYFGMLSIEPSQQGKGHGGRLIDAAEGRARECGCSFMDIHIVNLREELPGYYRRFGYVESGVLPFSDSTRASRPCHFIVMSKPLT
jgi:N-acetylglutamate synthase-like GNAT family acetyltransferase